MSLSTTFLGTLVLSVAMVTSSIGVPATVPSKPAAPAPPPALSRGERQSDSTKKWGFRMRLRQLAIIKYENRVVFGKNSKHMLPAPLLPSVSATPCMKALMNLESSCDGMDDHMKRVMAFGLLSCHISESGRHPLVCEDAIQECTRQLDEPGFLLFTTFLQHADNVCHYLQAELW